MQMRATTQHPDSRNHCNRARLPTFHSCSGLAVPAFDRRDLPGVWGALLDNTCLRCSCDFHSSQDIGVGIAPQTCFPGLLSAPLAAAAAARLRSHCGHHAHARMLTGTHLVVSGVARARDCGGLHQLLPSPC